MIKKELLLASWLEKLQKKWDNEEYYYDVEEATKVFKFVSKLTNDRGASRQFELLEFQFEIITEILCVKRRSDGKRKHREAHINIPRKNGKSFLAAIIVVYLFFCQRHIFGALFILTANTTKQAGELYATVEHFIKTNKTLRRYCKITSSTKTIVRKDNGNKLMVLSSDADNADSFNDYVAVLDEIHQAKNDEMYGKLRTGQGAWDEPLIMTITTASSGEDPANPEMQLYTMAKKIEAGEVNDPSFYYRIYEADKDCNVEDEAQWYKSNPALGVFRKLEDLANYAKRIRLMPLQENMFRRMFLNQHVALDHEKGAINMDLWDTCTKKVDTEDLKGWKCWGGLDLSSKNDITGFVLVFYEETTGRFIVVPYLYTPKETVAYRQHKDNNRLTPGDYALLFDTLYKYGFLAKAEGDKAKEVALGFRAKQGNGKYEFSWYYCGKAEHPDVTYETVKDKKTAQTIKITFTFYARKKEDTIEGEKKKLYALIVDESNLLEEHTTAKEAIAAWFSEVQEYKEVPKAASETGH